MDCSKLDLLLTPVWNGAEIHQVIVRIVADVRTEQGETLFSLHTRVTNKTFTELEGELGISDESGALSCQTDMEQEMHAELRRYIVQRDTQGRVRIEYTVKLKKAGANPCFDLGYEPGGMTGAGITFLPLFSGKKCDITVDWDLSRLPRGCGGVWTYGLGKASVTGPPTMLTEAFFCAGKLKHVESRNFRFSWIEKPDFNATEIAAWNRDTYALFAKFFHDEENRYSIFIRRSADTKPGGTAFGRSYMMIYPEEQTPALSKFLYAHEMIHNWVRLYDEPFGTCTWYMEGMAEYYSANLLWRNRLIDRAELAAEMNKRAKQYYENPYIGIKNEDAGALLFSDPDVTRVPYGRGLFYLMRTDAEIRKATGGTRSLDDVLFRMMERIKQDEKTGNREWLTEITDILGKRAEKEFEQMRNGVPIAPAVDCFAGGLQAIQTVGMVRGTDEPCVLWQFA